MSETLAQINEQFTEGIYTGRLYGQGYLVTAELWVAEVRVFCRDFHPTMSEGWRTLEDARTKLAWRMQHAFTACEVALGAQCPSPDRDNDYYATNRRAASALVNVGMGSWTYYTQWVSGATVWRDPLTDARVTVLADGTLGNWAPVA